MSEKRTWDENRSPQWRYLLSKDSKEQKEREKREERMDRAEGELLKKGISKRKRMAQERQKEKRKITKAGKEILYSASPGGENSSYRNTEFIESLHNRKTIIPSLKSSNNNNDES